MKFGFIGTGNMGTALIKGYLKAHPAEQKNLFAYDKDAEKLQALADEQGITPCESLEELMYNADAIVLAVKPGIFDSLLPEIGGLYQSHQVLVSIAAGISISYMEKLADATGIKIVRVMPNTPAMVNEGMSALCRNNSITDEEFEAVSELFRSVGKAEVVSEALIDTVIGVSGSSPAYTYMYIEALIDAAVSGGMDKDKALVFAAQSVLGAAKMVLETGIDPVTLRENVCSPGGTTIEAVKVLQNNGFHSNVQDAFYAAAEKSKAMTK
ncbi:MAG: proC [Bacillota bacterium]|jgi:pyrroline-5-carboxylate reductase|nr:proC [Bacillota bacterium]